jgi:hypothetical protein
MKANSIVIALLAAAFAALASARGQTNSAETPAGFTRSSGHGISFAYPSNWQKVPESAWPEGWAGIVELREDGRMIGQIGVLTFPQWREMRSEVLAAETAFLGVQRKGEDVRRGSSRPITVSNAKAARRLEYTYAAVFDGKKSGDTVHGTDITVVSKSGRGATVRITGVKGRLSEETVDQIVKSIAIE